MILMELKQYLSERGQVPLADLVHRFEVQPEALRGMLAHWIRKGKVRQRLPAGACGNGCCKCDPETLEVYEWIT